MPTELCASTGAAFVVIPIVVAYDLNSLLTKFFPASCMMMSGGPKYVLIQHIHSTSHVCFALMFWSHFPVWNRVASSTMWRSGFPLMYMMSTIML